LANSTLTGNTANGQGGALYTVDATDVGSIINSFAPGGTDVVGYQPEGS
jgi:predicted outer membrane repeat protein